MRVASLPRGAASVFGLGMDCDLSLASCCFAAGAVPAAAAASFSSTSFRACASASCRSISSSLGVSVTVGASTVVDVVCAADLVLLTGLESANGVDKVFARFGLDRLRSSDALIVGGCFIGAIISHTGSVGLDGSEEEDIGRKIVICELPHSPSCCLGEYAGVDGAESMKVPKDLADIGGDIGPGDRGVIGDDSAGEPGRMMVENL